MSDEHNIIVTNPSYEEYLNSTTGKIISEQAAEIIKLQSALAASERSKMISDEYGKAAALEHKECEKLLAAAQARIAEQDILIAELQKK